jgi:hypothetical protein
MELLNQDSLGFEFRFGRKPTFRSIKEIHDIWIRLKDRESERRKRHLSIWDEIYNEESLIEDKNGYIIIYNESKKEIRKYKLRKDSMGRKSYSYDVIKKLNDKESDREEKLNFLLTSEKSIELGKKFVETKKWLGKYHHRVKNIFIEKVCDELRLRFKNKKPDLITIVKIGDYKYYFSVKDPYSYYLEFVFLDEVKKDEIELL